MMKTKLFYFQYLFLCFLFFSIAACNNDDGMDDMGSDDDTSQEMPPSDSGDTTGDDDGGEEEMDLPPVSGAVQFLFRGEQWLSDEVSITFSSADINQLNVLAEKNGEEKLTITLNDTIPGTYKVNAENTYTGGFYGICTYINPIGSQNIYLSRSGEIILESIDYDKRLLSGTFSFKGRFEDIQHDFTQGSFFEIPF